MGFTTKQQNKIIFILFSFSYLSMIKGSNVNCNGKAFHCVNSTHFKICVDLGGGISKTVDDFLLPCPHNTFCRETNIYECEYYETTINEKTESSLIDKELKQISVIPLPIKVNVLPKTSKAPRTSNFINTYPVQVETTTVEFYTTKNLWDQIKPESNTMDTEILNTNGNNITARIHTYMGLETNKYPQVLPKEIMHPILKADESKVNTANFYSNTSLKLLNPSLNNNTFKKVDNSFDTYKYNTVNVESEINIFNETNIIINNVTSNYKDNSDSIKINEILNNTMNNNGKSLGNDTIETTYTVAVSTQNNLKVESTTETYILRDNLTEYDMKNVTHIKDFDPLTFYNQNTNDTFTINPIIQHKNGNLTKQLKTVFHQTTVKYSAISIDNKPLLREESNLNGKNIVNLQTESILLETTTEAIVTKNVLPDAPTAFLAVYLNQPPSHIESKYDINTERNNPKNIEFKTNEFNKTNPVGTIYNKKYNYTQLQDKEIVINSTKNGQQIKKIHSLLKSNQPNNNHENNITMSLIELVAIMDAPENSNQNAPQTISNDYLITDQILNITINNTKNVLRFEKNDSLSNNNDLSQPAPISSQPNINYNNNNNTMSLIELLTNTDTLKNRNKNVPETISNDYLITEKTVTIFLEPVTSNNEVQGLRTKNGINKLTSAIDSNVILNKTDVSLNLNNLSNNISFYDQSKKDKEINLTVSIFPFDGEIMPVLNQTFQLENPMFLTPEQYPDVFEEYNSGVTSNDINSTTISDLSSSTQSINSLSSDFTYAPISSILFIPLETTRNIHVTTPPDKGNITYIRNTTEIVYSSDITRNFIEMATVKNNASKTKGIAEKEISQRDNLSHNPYSVLDNNSNQSVTTNYKTVQELGGLLTKNTAEKSRVNDFGLIFNKKVMNFTLYKSFNEYRLNNTQIIHEDMSLNNISSFAGLNRNNSTNTNVPLPTIFSNKTNHEINTSVSNDSYVVEKNKNDTINEENHVATKGDKIRVSNSSITDVHQPDSISKNNLSIFEINSSLFKETDFSNYSTYPFNNTHVENISTIYDATDTQNIDNVKVNQFNHTFSILGQDLYYENTTASSYNNKPEEYDSKLQLNISNKSMVINDQLRAKPSFENSTEIPHIKSQNNVSFLATGLSYQYDLNSSAKLNLEYPSNTSVDCSKATTLLCSNVYNAIILRSDSKDILGNDRNIIPTKNNFTAEKNIYNSTQELKSILNEGKYSYDSGYQKYYTKPDSTNYNIQSSLQHRTQEMLNTSLNTNAIDLTTTEIYETTSKLHLNQTPHITSYTSSVLDVINSIGKKERDNKTDTLSQQKNYANIRNETLNLETTVTNSKTNITSGLILDNTRLAVENRTLEDQNFPKNTTLDKNSTLNYILSKVPVMATPYKYALSIESSTISNFNSTKTITSMYNNTQLNNFELKTQDTQSTGDDVIKKYSIFEKRESNITAAITLATLSNDKPESGNVNQLNKLTLKATSNERKKDSNYDTQIDIQVNSCINLTKGKHADKNDCRKFYLCLGESLPIIGECPNGTVFSETKKQCTKNLSQCYRNNQFKCLSPGRYYDVKLKNVYYICVQNKGKFIKFKFQCQSGYTLNTTSIHCFQKPSNKSLSSSSDLSNSKEESASISIESSSKSTNDSKPSNKRKRSTNFECQREGKFPHPEQCNKYYLCIKIKKDEFKQRLKDCESGEIFDKGKKKCTEGESSEC